MFINNILDASGQGKVTALVNKQLRVAINPNIMSLTKVKYRIPLYYVVRSSVNITILQRLFTANAFCVVTKL